MDVSIGSVAIVLAMTILSPLNVALRPPVPGATCFNSPAGLLANLPLSGGGTYQTDIVSIVGFGNPGEGSPAGWIFTNRRGQMFLSVRKDGDESAAEALTLAGAPGAARIALGAIWGAFWQIDRKEAVGLTERLAKQARLFRCFEHPLG